MFQRTFLDRLLFSGKLTASQIRSSATRTKAIIALVTIISSPVLSLRCLYNDSGCEGHVGEYIYYLSGWCENATKAIRLTHNAWSDKNETKADCDRLGERLGESCWTEWPDLTNSKGKVLHKAKSHETVKLCKRHGTGLMNIGWVKIPDEWCCPSPKLTTDDKMRHETAGVKADFVCVLCEGGEENI